MLEIYRPYAENLRTAECLQEGDCHMMKNNAYIIIDTLLNRLKDKKYDKFEDDHFVNYYWNNGKPYFEFLFDYYYSIYYLCTRQSGDIEDYAKGYESECRAYGVDAGIPAWSENMFDQHKMYLLKHDWFWYKRHFRDLYEYDATGYDLVDANGKPLSLDRKRLKIKIG